MNQQVRRLPGSMVGIARPCRPVFTLAIYLMLSGTAAVSSASAQAQSQPAGAARAAPAPIVFDGVTVVDVEQGKLVPEQRVVVVGNRIQTVGRASAGDLPKGAQVIDARGKYLIPGLWDMHAHPGGGADVVFPLLLANGVTGIRDAASGIPLDSLRARRQAVLDGARVGPPRQILSGPSIAGPNPDCQRAADALETCVRDSADARHLIDSLQAAKADMIKQRAVSRELYFVIAAEARKVGIPFGGHAEGETALEASDSGASIIDHIDAGADIDARCLWTEEPGAIGAGHDYLRGLGRAVVPRTYGASVEQCRAVADRFRKNGTWWVPTLALIDAAYSSQLGLCSDPLLRALGDRLRKPWKYDGNWLHEAAQQSCQATQGSSNVGLLHIAQSVGLPILAGTDVAGVEEKMATGFALHTELAMYASEGLTTADALRAATLNPAKMLHATDSLGTVAAGKLADLVLLDGDPLADITNTTTIRAVVANGRYFDRDALDHLLAESQRRAGESSESPEP